MKRRRVSAQKVPAIMSWWAFFFADIVIFATLSCCVLHIFVYFCSRKSILNIMCTYIINKRECQFPAINFNELVDYGTKWWGAKGIPYTCYYLAFKAREVDDNVFLYNLLSRMWKYCLIGQMQVFEGYIHDKADSMVAGRSIFVLGWVMPDAENELRAWLDRLCDKNYVLLQPYWLAVGLDKAVDEVERRWK